MSQISTSSSMVPEKLGFILLLSVLSTDLRSLASDIDSAKVVFYFGPTYAEHQSYDLDKAASILEHPKFVHNQTNFYIHGYTGSQEAFSTRLMVNSYLKGNTTNLLTIDWKELASGSYISAQHNLLKLGPKIAESILQLIDAGLDKNSLSLVGHSLGGRGVGIIAREVFSNSDGKVLLPRITALDPSNAEAHDEFILPPVTKTDAKFVDVIHTDAGNVGTSERMGHADFWPNGGKAIQPGCPAPGVNDKCSHRKAWAYWAESVANIDQEPFWAFLGESYEDFLEDGAEHLNDTVVLMGFYCSTSARGNYFLQIDSDYGSVPEIGLSS